MFGDGDNKNLIMAAVLSMAVVFGWQAFFVTPPPPPKPATQTSQQAPAQGTGTSKPAPAASTAAGTAGGSATSAADTAAVPASMPGEATESSPRIKIRSDAVRGSIALTGGRLDDLHLTLYRQTLAKDSPTVVLLRPAGQKLPYFVDYGWRPVIGGYDGPLPGPDTKWSVDGNDVLTPKTPVVLRWDNGKGLIFKRKFEIDHRYMFTVTQSVENSTGTPVAIAPYGVIVRRGEPKGIGYYLLHEGAVGDFDGTLSEPTYKDMRGFDVNKTDGDPQKSIQVKHDGWLGFTNKYWMTTLAPLTGQAFDAVYRLHMRGKVEEFRTEALLPNMNVAAGGKTQVVTHLFAGAKELETIANYQDKLGIHAFYDSIDWGWFYFLTKPIAWLLNRIKGLVGNMGLSIIILTFMVKAALFPLAYKSFVSMSKMKKLQPEMEKLKERVGDDKQKLQQEMMALYKKEKVNPAAGCLPIILQIPIFFSLYKVLFVTIEMRHAPFFGWIRDLSAPDPTSWMNLFGLLPYSIPPYLHTFSIGVFPILMGITMFLQQKLNPAPADKTQQMIFAWMPWVFMFMLGRFASGLVIYWCANNMLTFTQQYLIMRSQGIDVDLLGNITGGKKGKGAREKAKGAAHAAAGAGADGDGGSGAEAPAESGSSEASDAPKRNKPPRSRQPRRKR